jgi:serine/threonine-protein kinase
VCQTQFNDPAPMICPADGSPLLRTADITAAEGDPMLGRVLAGRFTILARIGSGSMGTVYRARQSPIARDVAIKILRSDRAIDEVSRARFLREARANSLLTSPNTVTVFDFGQSETGDFYLAMELLEGESLGQRIKRLGRMPVEDAVEAVKQALRSLAEAHAKGIIHRDLKPDNLFFARVRTNEKYEEIVKVLDFGIAKMLHADGEFGMNAVETQAGTVFGTPRYMSPEQAQGKPLDARSDLYSLGVILYHMLTGRPPFTDDDAIVVMARHIKTMPRPMSEVAPETRIAAEVESLVMRVLSKEPEKRPESADALAAELSRLKDTVGVTSGVRSSLVGSEVSMGIGIVGSENPRSNPPPALAPSSSLTHDSFSLRVFPPKRSRRGVYFAGALLVGAALAAAFGPLAMQRLRSASATPSMPLPADATNVSRILPAAAPSPSQAALSVSAGGPVLSTPTVQVSAARMPPPSSPASAPQRQERPERTPRPARTPAVANGTSKSPGTSPTSATTSAVGYGYLE